MGKIRVPPPRISKAQHASVAIVFLGTRWYFSRRRRCAVLCEGGVFLNKIVSRKCRKPPHKIQTPGPAPLVVGEEPSSKTVDCIHNSRRNQKSGKSRLDSPRNTWAC